eukprot:411774-Prorocentrum_minimum.AAC.1
MGECSRSAGWVVFVIRLAGVTVGNLHLRDVSHQPGRQHQRHHLRQGGAAVLPHTAPERIASHPGPATRQIFARWRRSVGQVRVPQRRQQLLLLAPVALVVRVDDLWEGGGLEGRGGGAERRRRHPRHRRGALVVLRHRQLVHLHAQ